MCPRSLLYVWRCRCDRPVCCLTLGWGAAAGGGGAGGGSIGASALGGATGRSTGSHGSRPARRRPQLGPASVSLLTPVALGVLKARRAGLLSGMGSPCLPLWCWLGVVVDDGGAPHVVFPRRRSAIQSSVPLGFFVVPQAGLCTKVRYVAESAHFVLWLAY